MSGRTQHPGLRRQRRCRSWRPLADSPHPIGHLPGECRRCWGLCRSVLDENPPGDPGDRRRAPDAPVGPGRCEDCAFALATHPDSRIRKALVAEDHLPVSVAELLASDFDATVAHAARWHLERALRSGRGAP